MENTKEVMMAIMSSDTKEVVKELEILDESSMVLAKTYIRSCLVSLQRIKNVIS